MRKKLKSSTDDFGVAIHEVMVTAGQSGNLKAIQVFDEKYVPCMEEVDKVIEDMNKSVDDRTVPTEIKFLDRKRRVCETSQSVLKCFIIAMFEKVPWAFSEFYRKRNKEWMNYEME